MSGKQDAAYGFEPKQRKVEESISVPGLPRDSLMQQQQASCWKKARNQAFEDWKRVREREEKMKVLTMLMKYRGVNKMKKNKTGQEQECFYSAEEWKI